MPAPPTSPGSLALTIRHATGTCPVHLGTGLLGLLPDLVAQYLGHRRIAVIADSTVASLVHHGLDAPLFTFPAGEASKTRATWADLTDRMLAAGFGRDSSIVALGGGVTGDLAGFVAATYMRGVPVLQVPTSLLAMVDASIGGKTGVDVPAGKNLVGAFHQPVAVVIDPAVLSSLPAREWRQGLAEVVKHALIADRSHFEQLEHAPEELAGRSITAVEPLIRRSIAIKAEVVEADETESGRRAVLNAGHTVAHALEQATGYALRHGEAVAIGLVTEAGLGEAIGVTSAGTHDRLAALLGDLGLPTEVPSLADRELMLSAMAADKKNRDGTIRFSLPAAIGSIHGSDDTGWTVPVSQTRIREFLSPDD